MTAPYKSLSVSLKKEKNYHVRYDVGADVEEQVHMSTKRFSLRTFTLTTTSHLHVKVKVI